MIHNSSAVTLAAGFAGMLGLGLCSSASAQLSVASEALAARSDHLWPTAPGTTKTTINVCFKNGSQVERQAVQTVVEGSWEQVPAQLATTEEWGVMPGWGAAYGVDFQGWGDCPANPIGEFVSINFNNAALGAAGIVHGQLGTGALSKDPSMEFETGTPSVRTIIHEFGHALGFAHEFIRSDFPSVDPTCAATGGTAADIGVTGPDTGSIMNYLSCGAGRALDHEDLIGFSRIYGPSLIRFGDRVVLRINGTVFDFSGDGTTVVGLESPAGKSGYLQGGDAIAFTINGQPVLWGVLGESWGAQVIGVNDAVNLYVTGAPTPVQLMRVDGMLEP